MLAMNRTRRAPRSAKRGLYLAIQALCVLGMVLVSANACLTPEYIFPPNDGMGGAVYPAHCSDGNKDPNESDLDCGGDDCPGCAIGRDCEADIDCAVKNCVMGKCKEPGCGDGAQNPGETDIDCGGVCGATCGIDQRCEKDGDCASGSCQARRCVDAQCDDSKQNNGETDVDCGGSRCGGTCEVGKLCESHSDCRQPDPSEAGDIGSARCVADDSGEKRCELSCPVRRGDCDQLAQNGCETDTDSSTSHCGRCDQPCAPPHTKLTHCEVGACIIDECAEGYVNCEDDEPGCETNLTNDPDHCSSCENDCSDTNGQDSCEGGVCGIQCDDGFRDCDADVNPGKTGCEINVTNNVKHCGGCSTEEDDFACPDDQDNGIYAVCVDGDCDQVDCSSYEANTAACDGDGVCDDKLTTPVNCGGCGIACLVEHGTPACYDEDGDSDCGTAGCDTNYADCDNKVVDCEVDIRSDVKHCGGCSDDTGVDCTALVADTSKHVADALCQSATCVIVACSPGYADCDLDLTNGCESDISSTERCGGCTESDPNEGDGVNCQDLYPKAPSVDCNDAGFCEVDCPSGFCPNSSGECSVPLGSVQSCKSCGQVCSASGSGTSAVCDASAGCQVAYPVEVVNTKTAFNNAGTSAPDLNLSIDIGSGPSRGLVILAATSHTPTIKFEGTTLTPIASVQVANHTGYTAIAFVNDAALGAAGSKNVTVASTWGGKVVTLLELNNVAQTAARDTNLRTGACSGDITQPTDVSLPNSLVVAALHLQKDTELSGTPIGLTEAYDKFAGSDGQLTGLMGYQTNVSANVTIGWNVGPSCWNSALATASFNPRMVAP